MRLHFTGVNPNKLHDELIASGVIPQLVESLEADTWITVEDSQVDAVNAVVEAHDPGPVLTDVQLEKITEINSSYQETLSSGFVSSATGSPFEYDYKPDDRADFQKFTLTMALGIASFPVPIGLKDNSVVNHTQGQYMQLLQDIQAFEWGLKERKRMLVGQVNEATSVEQVNAVQW
jgi:hypothetical protein